MHAKIRDLAGLAVQGLAVLGRVERLPRVAPQPSTSAAFVVVDVRVRHCCECESWGGGAVKSWKSWKSCSRSL